MASNIDTLQVETQGTTPETFRPGGNRRGVLTWVAVFGAGTAVAGLAVATFSGGDHDGDIAARYRAAQVAEREERQAHLEGQARTHAQRPARTTLSAELYRAAQLAEREERQAHLEGQATTYGRRSAATALSAELYRAAQLAEREEWQAHLDGQARTHGSTASSDTQPAAAAAPERE